MPAITFKTSEAKEQSFEPLPAGKYKAVITEVEDKTTKNGDGNYFNFKYQVVEGPHANRVVFDMVNYNNPSAQAQEIGRGTLRTIAKALGKVDPADTDELCNLPLYITVTVQGDTQYGPKNKIKKWEPATGQAAAAPQATGAAPWKR